jgi:hypothetical protein
LIYNFRQFKTEESVTKSYLKKITLPILSAILLIFCLFGCGTKETFPVSSAPALSAVSSSSAVSSAASSSKAASGSKANDKKTSSPSNSPTGTSKEKPETKTSPKYSAYVTLTIDATKDDGGIIANEKSVGINPGDTVYSVLKRYCDANNISLSAEKTGFNIYISAINGDAQFDNGSQSGWIYSVNGTFSSQGCNSYKLHGGENIKWVYTTDLGKSEEK